MPLTPLEANSEVDSMYEGTWDEQVGEKLFVSESHRSEAGFENG